MKCTLLAASALALTAASAMPAKASSHREAPMIAGMPRLDASDFYMFRSYEKNRSDYVTMIADYVPLQDPGGGPNFYQMEQNGYYDINVDQTGSGKPTFAFRFRFRTSDKRLSLNIGGATVAIPLINDGQIAIGNRAAQNVVETYTVSLVTYSSTGVPTETCWPAMAETRCLRSPQTISATSRSPTMPSTPPASIISSTSPAAAAPADYSWASARIRSSSTSARRSTW